MKLDREYYLKDDVVSLAKDLLGKYLFTRMNGRLTGGVIIETEAYAGVTDRASHAWNGRRTARTEIMYASGGIAYIYLCYGVHSLFNIVTNVRDIPHAILIRGVHPTEGIRAMLERTGKSKVGKGFGVGPGKVSKMLGIHYSQTGEPLTGDRIWVEDRGIFPDDKLIRTTKRIGVEYAAQDAGLPYRFVINPSDL